MDERFYMTIPAGTEIQAGTRLCVTDIDPTTQEEASEGDEYSQAYIDLIGTIVTTTLTLKIIDRITILDCKGQGRKFDPHSNIYNLYSFELSLPHSVDWWDIWLD